MPPSNDAPPNPLPPLCVDLDGTLIKTDLNWESLARLLRRNPFYLLPVLFWLIRGRAVLKEKLAARIQIDPATLPYNREFLDFLQKQKKAGRRLLLVTASNRTMAGPVAAHVGIFDEVLASDSKINLRSGNKRRALVEKFGERGYDYAGNSTADLAVWQSAREAVVVNAGRSLTRRASQCAPLGPVFNSGFSPLMTAGFFLRELFWNSGYLGAIAAGLLLAAAFPGPGIAGFAWIAPGLMLACARGKTGGESFRIGYVAGLAFSLMSFSWILLIPVAGFPILGWISLGAYLAIFPAVWVWMLSDPPDRGAWPARTLWCLGGAAAWVALEMARARLLGGIPWNLLGVSQFRLVPLIQIASVTGVYGVSFLVVWFSLSLYSAAQAIMRNPASRFAWQAEIALPLVTVLVLFISSFARPAGPVTAEATIDVTLVQPNVPQTLIWDEHADEVRFQQLLSLSQQALRQHTDLLIWPESAIPGRLRYDPIVYQGVTNLAQANHVWMIVNSEDTEPAENGSADPGDNRDFNSSFLVSPQGGLMDTYHKRKLVIFGEYIPLVRWLPFIKYFTPISGGFTPGKKPVTFTTDQPVARISTLICYEDIFPHLVREYAGPDTDFLVNLTNDGWFGNGAAQWQQAANALFRAVENRLPLIRCSNNGLTCWIDERGRIREFFQDSHGDIHGTGAMTVRIPLRTSAGPAPSTFYNRHGDYFGWLCVPWAAAILFLRWTTGRMVKAAKP